MRVSRVLVLFGALALAACSGEPPITVEDGSIRQYVSTIEVRRAPIVKVLVLDDRNIAALDSVLASSSGVIEHDLVALATGFELGDGEPNAEDYPQEVALVVVFPASGRIAAAPEVPALHVRSPAFWAADAKAMADAIRSELALATSAPRLGRYAPIDMARDIEALVGGTREARTSQEARIAADVAGIRSSDLAPTVVTGAFDGMEDVPEGSNVDLLLVSKCPPKMAGRCRDAIGGTGIWSSSGGHRNVIVPRGAVGPDGRAACVVEVSGVALGCESRGWSRVGNPGRPYERETCTVPQLEGAAQIACRDGVRCESCDAGFCVGRGSGTTLAFTKRAYPRELDAEVRVVCTY